MLHDYTYNLLEFGVCRCFGDVLGCGLRGEGRRDWVAGLREWVNAINI